MADLSDIENAMVDIIAASLQLGDGYLAGSSVMSDPSGTYCKVYRGWPVTNQLNQDLTAGIASVTVFSIGSATRNTTRHFLEWRQGPTITPTMTAAVSGNIVTFTGIGGLGQVAGVGFGPPANTGYAYRMGVGDTVASVAAALQALIPGSSVAGSVLTLPTDLNVRAVVAADQPAWKETRRQEQRIDVYGWFKTPQVRDQVMSIVDAGFANMTDQYGRLTDQFGLPDGSNAIIRYVSSNTDDRSQQAGLWRRTLCYRVEYPTTLLEQQPLVIFAGGTLTARDVETELGSLSPPSSP